MRSDIKQEYDKYLKQFWEKLTPMVAELVKTRNDMAERARGQAKKLRDFGQNEKAARMEGMADVYEETAGHVQKLVDDEELRGLFIDGPPWVKVTLDLVSSVGEDVNKFFERDKKKTEALESIAASLVMMSQQQKQV
jgi:hypothetical protein